MPSSPIPLLLPSPPTLREPPCRLLVPQLFSPCSQSPASKSKVTPPGWGGVKTPPNLSLVVRRFSQLGKVEDPAQELANGDIFMTNSTRDPSRIPNPARDLRARDANFEADGQTPRDTSSAEYPSSVENANFARDTRSVRDVGPARDTRGYREVGLAREMRGYPDTRTTRDPRDPTEVARQLLRSDTNRDQVGYVLHFDPFMLVFFARGTQRTCFNRHAPGYPYVRSDPGEAVTSAPHVTRGPRPGVARQVNRSPADPLTGAKTAGAQAPPRSVASSQSSPAASRSPGQPLIVGTLQRSELTPEEIASDHSELFSPTT